jgi:hypothetical protein
MRRDYNRGGCGRRPWLLWWPRKWKISRQKKLEHAYKLQTTRKPEMKFFPHRIGRERQTAIYDIVNDYIVQVIQKAYKNGQDTAVSIRDLKKKYLTHLRPIRGVAAAADMAETLQQQNGMDIIYQAKLERYLDRKDILEQNLTKAYALIFSNFCNKTMQNSIEEHPD